MTTGTSSPEQAAPVKEPKQYLAAIQTAVTSLDFQLADRLRDELMNNHPMALAEVLQSARTIEEAKTANLDRDHLAIWDELYQKLTEEETNCLFYSLKELTVPPKKRILAHGTYNSKLFFIDKGTVTVFITKDNKNKVIAQLGRGDLLGEYTFTSICLCSASVVSTSEVHLRYVDSSVAEQWTDNQPALYDKLVEFCRKSGKIDDIVKSKTLEKRDHERFIMQGDIHATILDKDGNKTKTSIRGSLSNISEVGCCFDIHCSKRETAKALLARNCYIEFTVTPKNTPYSFVNFGRIVRMSFHLHNDYSTHIQFLKPLNEKIMQNLS